MFIKLQNNVVKSVQQLAIILFMAVFLIGLTLSLLSPSPTQAEKTIEKETISSLIEPQTGTLPAQIIITDSGFIPTVLTIEVGSTVSWLNQTATTQQLGACLTTPTSYQIYLPFILKSSVALKQQVPTNKITRQAGTLITATITAGGSYSHTFNTVGEFVYCLDTSPPYSHTIIVLEATPSSGDFSLTITPTVQKIIQGDNAVFTLDITALNGFTESVSLTASGLTEGISSTFNPNPAIPDSQSTLTVSTALSTSIGSYPLTIWGIAGDITHTVDVTLTVEAALNPDFSLTVSPISQTIQQGNFVTYTVHLTAVNGFSSSVSLSISDLPTDTVALFSQNSVTPSAQTTLTLKTELTTPVGTYPITVVGTSESITKTDSSWLNINQTVCGLLPIAMHQDTLIGWQEGSSEVRDIWNGGSSTDRGWLYWNAFDNNPNSDDIGLLLKNPAFVNTDFVNPANLSDTQLQTGDWVASAPGSMSILETSDRLLSMLAGKTFMVPVWDVFETSPQSGYLRDAYHIVQFALVKLTGDNYLPNSGGGGWIKAKLVDADVNYACDHLPNLNISWWDDSPVPLTTTGPFTLTAIIQNQSHITITTPFSLSWLVASEITGDMITVEQLNWVDELGPLTTINLTKTFNFTTTGAYTVYAQADSTDTIYEANEMDNIVKRDIIYLAPDFELTISPTHQSVFAGSSITYTVSLNAINGFNAPVTLSTANLPANTIAQFSQNSINPSTQAILTLTTAISPPLGTFPIPIMGNSQNITHYITPTLTINDEFAEGCGLLPIAMNINTLNGWQPGSSESRDIWNGGSVDDRGWLFWNAFDNNPNADDVEVLLLNPSLVTTDYVNPANIADAQLQAGDWVASAPGSLSAIDYINGTLSMLAGKTFRVPVWDVFETTQQTGYLRDAYHIVKFAMIKFTGDNYLPTSGGGGWIKALLVDNDVSFICTHAPNLTLQAPTSNPITPTANVPFELSTVITNQSPATVTTPFSVDWYATVNSAYPPVVLGQSSWVGGQLGPYMTTTLTNTFMLTTAGTYTFYAYVDSNNAIYETNERDNLMPPYTQDIPFDIALVMDRSGSMEYNPICYGCWERNWFDAQDYIDSGENPEDDNPRWSGFYQYRGNGSFYPLGSGVGADPDGSFTHPDRVRACTTNSYEANDDLPIPKGAGEKYTFNAADTVYQNPGSNDNYIIIEAELYAYNTSPPEFYIIQQGKGYWVLQRGEGNYGNESNPYIVSQGTAIDDDNPDNNISPGTHMAHHPSSTEINGIVYGKHYNFSDANAHDAPALEYDFRFYNQDNYPDLPTSWGIQGIDNVAIWVRVHAGKGLDYASADDNDPSDPTGSDDDKDDHIANNVFYWKLLSSPNESIDFDPFQNTPTQEIGLTEVSGANFGEGVIDVDANGEDNYWRWIKLGEFPLHYFDSISNPKIYRLYVYAGSAGFSIDRIILTNNLNSTGNNGDGSALGNARTADVTTASAYRIACDICNTVYGENVPGYGLSCTYYNNVNGIPFASIYPNGLGLYLRDNRLEPLFSEWESPMRTVKEVLKTSINRLDPKWDQAGLVSYSAYGTTKTELTCLRAGISQTGLECTTGNNPYLFTEVLRDIENTRASDDTSTATGLRAGLETLGFLVDPNNPPPGYDTNCTGLANSSCTRGNSAQRILILISDGEPDNTSGECNLNEAPPWTPNTEAYRCPLLYAQQAAANGIRVYAIAIGYGSNFEFMQAIADYGGGQAYFSASGGDLDLTFNTILNADPFPMQAKEAGEKP